MTLKTPSPKKPSTSEEEYFVREEAEKKRQLAVERMQAIGQAERARLQQTHHMRCPQCGMELHRITYRTMPINKCFGCNGIFLSDAVLQKLAGSEGYWERLLQFFAGAV